MSASRPCHLSSIPIAAGVVPGARRLRFGAARPFSTDTPPLVLGPAAQAGVVDKRARFREIYCAVLEARGDCPTTGVARKP